MKTVGAATLCVGRLLGGCATGYKSSGIGGGFSETALAPGVYRVKFQGNGYTAPDRAADFALLRACELCLKDGFSFFSVIDETRDQRNVSYTQPGMSTTQGTISSVGNSAVYRGTTTTGPAITTHIRYPSTGLVVKMAKEGPADGISTFDAKWLQASLKSRYKIE